MQKKLYKVSDILPISVSLKMSLNPLQSSLPRETINPQKWLIFWKDQ